jgi:TolB-like protein/DNA-binding winged helix-turn-helix (wHTH) protein
MYRFGPFESHPRSRELLKHGVRLRIRPQPLQVLNLLLSRAGDVVTRESLREQLWSSETFVDFEPSLNTAVKELRAVLGDSAAESRYVETLPRLGYRFIAPVEVIEEPANRIQSQPSRDEARSDEEEFVESAALDSAALRPKGRRWLIALAIPISLVLVLSTGAYLLWSRNAARSQPAIGRIMLAILPFENLTGDAAQEYFSDGLTEEMIAQMGHTDPQHLGVIARTSVMHYKHTKEQADQIGRDLGVQYVLEGSVRQDADRIRITAQLIQTKDQSHVWSHQYDRTPNSLLSLQGEIAQEISDAIQLTIGNHGSLQTALAAASPAPKSYEAYDLYLQGRYFWNKRTVDGFQRSVGCFERAIAKDPRYARAYAGLADSYALMAAYYVAPQNELIPKARDAALKALQLDGNLAEAHVSLAVIARNYDWDWQTAEKEFRRAIALDPNYATGHHWYAEHLAFSGRFEESFEEMRRARQLDPLSLIIQTDDAAGMYYARQYDRAIAQFRAVEAVEPHFARVRMVSLAYVQQGRYSEALADIDAWQHQENPSWVWIWSQETYVFGRAGQHEQAQRSLEELLHYSRTHALVPMIFVMPYIGVGDKDQAFAWLDKSVAAHSPGLATLKVDPMFDPLRSDPRFDDLLRRVGLAQ